MSLSERKKGEEDRRVGKEVLGKKGGHGEMKRGDGSKKLSEQTGKAEGMNDDPREPKREEE